MSRLGLSALGCHEPTVAHLDPHLALRAPRCPPSLYVSAVAPDGTVLSYEQEPWEHELNLTLVREGFELWMKQTKPCASG